MSMPSGRIRVAMAGELVAVHDASQGARRAYIDVNSR